MAGQALGFKAELEFDATELTDVGLLETINVLGKHSKILLFLDEVQELARNQNNEIFLARLRTALDINKDSVKVLFTGSSREGLRQMFSHASAPFFHFGQNLDFPPLEKAFTDHLCDVFSHVTARKLDKEDLWNAFQKLEKVPQLIRSLVERMALNPGIALADSLSQLLSNLHEDRGYPNQWHTLSELQQLLVLAIIRDDALFAKEALLVLRNSLGVDAIKISTVQSALRTLERKRLIIKSYVDRKYYLEDPNFASWVASNFEQVVPIS